jgi:hypothetical protein
VIHRPAGAGDRSFVNGRMEVWFHNGAWHVGRWGVFIHRGVRAVRVPEFSLGSTTFLFLRPQIKTSQLVLLTHDQTPI